MPARLGEPQRGSALDGEALVGALRSENYFLKSARIEPKLFLLFAYVILTLRPGGKHGPVSQTSQETVGFGDFWGDGADSAQKVDTLAGRRVSSTPGKRRDHTLKIFKYL